MAEGIDSRNWLNFPRQWEWCNRLDGSSCVWRKHRLRSVSSDWDADSLIQTMYTQEWAVTFSKSNWENNYVHDNKPVRAENDKAHPTFHSRDTAHVFIVPHFGDRRYRLAYGVYPRRTRHLISILCSKKITRVPCHGVSFLGPSGW